MKFRDIKVGEHFVTDNTCCIKTLPIQAGNGYVYPNGEYANSIALCDSLAYRTGEEIYCDDDDVVGRIVYQAAGTVVGDKIVN